MRLKTTGMSLRPNLCFGPPGVAGLALALTLSTVPSRAAENARSFELTWDAPPECPTAQEVERDITRLIGESSHERTVRASATVTGSDDDWKVRVRMETGGEISERSLSAPTCRALEKAVALVIAITIEPRAASGEPPPPPPVEPPPPKPPPPPPPPPVVREPPLKWFAALGPVTEIGLLPQLGVGGELSAGLRLPIFSAELSGAMYVPESTTVKGPSGGRFTLASGGLRACGRVLGGQVELFGCAETATNRLAGRGFGVTAPGSASTMLAGFGVGPRVDVRLSPVFLLLFDVEAIYAPGRASFVLDNVGRVYTAKHIGMSGRLGLAAQFW
jgi:hypothetical protein